MANHRPPPDSSSGVSRQGGSAHAEDLMGWRKMLDFGQRRIFVDGHMGPGSI
jgi:hypothetical protein